MQASGYVKSLLGLSADSPACSVHFGSNSHELVVRLLSVLLDSRHTGQAARHGSESSGDGCPDRGGATRPALRVLASDCEFYSFTRQINRLIGKLTPRLMGCNAAGGQKVLQRITTRQPAEVPH